MYFDISHQRLTIHCCRQVSKVRGLLRLAWLPNMMILIFSLGATGTDATLQSVHAQDDETQRESSAAGNLPDTFFEQQVAPILQQHCLECHAGSDPDGGLVLTSRDLMIQGGDSGPAIEADELSQSLLWQRISAGEMPPSEPLPQKQQQIIQEWIVGGVVWNSGPIERQQLTTANRAGKDWWSLQPLRGVSPPRVDDPAWERNPIDTFIRQAQLAKGLSPAPPAGTRELLRRLHIDLVGLPPTPQELDAFDADPSEEHYRQIIDRLLASPQYGERWGRHWLDVVRFGESDGFERNFPRDNAWYYRDWVINALNLGMPYDQFVRQQLVGDLEPGGVEGAAATGFWTAGVHNTVVGGSRRMQQLARQDEIEDVLGTIGQTFLGLTINCARCHDHKFDPVSIDEYYSLASAISGLGFGERSVESQAEKEKLSEVVRQLELATSQLVTLERSAIATLKRQSEAQQENTEPTETPASGRSLEPLAAWEFEGDLRDSVSGLEATAVGKPIIEDGALLLDGASYVVTPPLATHVKAKTLEVWVQLTDLKQAGGAAVSLQTLNGNTFDAIVFGEQQPSRWMAGSNSFERTAPFASNEATQLDETQAVDEPVHIVMVYHEDGAIDCYRNGERYGSTIRRSPLQPFTAGECNLLFGLRHEPGMGNRYLRGKLHRAALYLKPLTEDEVKLAYAEKPHRYTEEQLLAALSPAERQQRRALQEELADLRGQQQLLATAAVRKIYTLSPGGGEQVKLLRRGDPDLAAQVVAPGGVQAVASQHGDFGLPNDAPESLRRRKLADWITSPDNPLFARVIVNRVWHYHFGTGLVDTPNDFGFNGGRPSHPELLDHLASSFQASGYRLKDLHRQIVTSQTYRQTAIHLTPEAISEGERLDGDNRLLWRSPVRRLEAETLRDAMLSVAGQLNTKAGGPSFRDVSVTENSGTTYYEPLDAGNSEHWRRTVYRFNPRGGRSALLDTFDCPDPASAAPRRAVTTTPLQALSLLNNSFVLHMSKSFAETVRRQVGEKTDAQLRSVWLQALGREPTPSELQLGLELLEQHGLEAVCRAVFNLNEFVLY